MAKKHKTINNTKIEENQTCNKVSSAKNSIMKVIKKSRKNSAPRDSPFQRSSVYRGVTRHRWTGRYEAHLWDKHSWNESQNKKGKQVYLGAYDDEETAAHAYDLAALKYWGPDKTILNFSTSTYEEELKEMEGQSKEEYIGSLRRKSNGFSRGVSKYRGVARHHQNGRWEARIGRVFGNKYLYLGTYATQEEAAIAYDMAAIQYRGPNAVTNFDISRYNNLLTTNLECPNADLSTNNDTISSINYEVDDTLISSMLTNPSDNNLLNYFQYDINTSSSLTSTPSSSSMSISDNQRQSKCSFPDDIQTYFECLDGGSYNEEEDYIFGDINSILLPIFQCDLDV